MRKKIIVFLLALLIISTSISAFLSASAEQTKLNRFNVVFVIDASGSMKQTDPDNMRFDATTYFLGLLADDGNYVGSVVFSTDVIKATDIKEIKGKSDKERIESEIEKCEYGDWTAIGTAVKKGVDMLVQNGNKDLPSVIVLLSDGKSDMESEDKLKECNDQKASALVDAYNNNIQIYTVGLNSNGGADIDELKQISKATNGECEEVKNAADLTAVYQRFYQLIYGPVPISIVDKKKAENGKISEQFTVPGAGVEEVNIIIHSESPIEDLSLQKPSGEKLASEDILKMTTKAKTFLITKIPNPDGGEWSVSAKAKPGTYFSIDMIYNDCLSATLECDKQKDVNVNDSITFTGLLLNNDARAKDGYDDYSASIHIQKRTSSNAADSKEMEFPMSVKDASYEYSFKPDEIGTYTAYMTVKGDGINKSTKDTPIVIDAGNPAPVTKKKLIEQHFWVIPFFTDKGDIDLSGAVQDETDSEVVYSVVSTAFKDSSYELKGTTLTIKDFYDLSEGVFAMRGTDSYGASADFQVKVTTTNVGIIALIVIGAAIIILLAAFGIITYILLNKRFMGECFVSTFNNETGEYSEEVKRRKNRGRLPLSAFGLNPPGFNASKCYIQATGKDYVEFCSPKPVYGGGSKSKKIKITGLETQITADSGASSGIIIRFASRLNPNNGGW